MRKTEKVQKKKISLTKLLLFRLCINMIIKDIFGVVGIFFLFFFPSLERKYFSQIFIYICILPKRKNLKGFLHWM